MWDSSSLRHGDSSLAAGSVIGYLAERGLLPGGCGGADAKVTELGGGVSSLVVLVEVGSERLVVKQPRRQLLVKDDWFASPGRALTEARALGFTHGLTPAEVPRLVDVDPAALTLTMTAAPPSWRPWKELLLQGKVERWVAARLGRVLGRWHGSSAENLGQLRELCDLSTFEELRIEPFHLTVIQRHPELGQLIARAIEALTRRPGRCLVHGDFSPKNILVGDSDLWVIDFEVAHTGDPAFDVAFLITHLLLKSIHRPTMSREYRACASQFLESYKEAAGSAFVPSDECLALQVGCLVLARVDGKSPAGYLAPDEERRAWRVGLGLLHDLVHPLTDDAWPDGSLVL